MRFPNSKRPSALQWRPLWALAVGIAATGIAAADLQAAEPAPKTLVVLGDSLAAGYGLNPADAYPAVLQQWIRATGLPFRVANAGVSGDTTAGGVRRVDWILKRPVDVLLLELGGNDGLRGLSPTQTRSNLVTIILKTRAAYPQVRVVVAGMQIPSNLGAEYTQAFRELFPEVAKSQSAVLIPFLLEGVGGVAALNQSDQIHPTAEGHRQVATNVWKVLEPLLQSASSAIPSPSAPSGH